MLGHKKGATLLEMGMAFGFGILMIGIILGAGAIATTAMQNTATDTNISHGIPASVYMATGNASSSLVNMSIQMPTVGTIAGVGLIILVLFTVIGVYIFGKK